VGAQVNQDAHSASPFTLTVIHSDHETLLIHVGYDASVDRAIMNARIDTVREVIMITAKSYGWDNWIKVKERVEMYKR
jgi:hypothetical protein